MVESKAESDFLDFLDDMSEFSFDGSEEADNYDEQLNLSEDQRYITCDYFSTENFD